MGYYIEVEENIKIYIQDINEEAEKTIVFLHGWPGSHKLFEYQFNCLSSKGYRCIGIDQRGFGESDKPVYGYDYDRLADDLKCIVEELGLNNFTLLGHSTGGAIAIKYMAKYKEFGVSKLILCAAAAPSLIRRLDFPYGIKKEDVEKIIKETYEDRPKMLNDFGKTFFHNKVSKPFSQWFLSLGLEAAGWSTAAIANTWIDDKGLSEDMRKICVPTLILQGVHDKVVLPELSEQQQKLIENSKLIKFEKSGHGLFYDEREKFNKEVMDFIEVQKYKEK